MKSIAQIILHHAESSPGKTALITSGGKYTYAELADSIKKIALWIRNSGYRDGERIIVEAAHTYAYAAVCYGLELAHCVFVPVEFATPAERMDVVSAETGASLLITQRALETRTDSICIGDLWSAAEALDAGVFRDWETDGTELIEILFTTGTTGKSKGVMISCLNQVAIAEAVNECVELLPDNVWLIPTPMNHAAGLRKMHMGMFAGATTVLLDGFRNLKLFFAMIDEHRVTSLYLPPAAIHFMLAFAGKELAALDGQLRFIYSSSAMYPQRDKDKMKALLPHVRMFNMYGASECGAVCVSDFNSDDDIPGTVGRVSKRAEILILDENRNPIADSSKEHYGNIAIRSRSVMMGYWNEPELTASVLRDGMLITSDNGYFENGMLFLLGRSNDIINFGGFKIAPNEVEDVVIENDDSIDECVLILAGRESNPFLKLIAVVKEGCLLDQQHIFGIISRKLEPYKLPKVILQVDHLEKTFNGKLDRRKMAELYK